MSKSHIFFRTFTEQKNVRPSLSTAARRRIFLCWGGFIHQDDKPALLERARAFIKNRFPRVDFGKLGPIAFSKKPGNETTIVSFGTKGGETEIFKNDGKGLYQKLINKFKTSLGPEAESLIAQDNDEMRKPAEIKRS